MTQILYVVLFYLISLHSYALNIRQIVLSQLSDSTINVSLDTEGKELYYFSNWDYQISENTVVLKARFIEGFGSTIAFLNNNFEVPLNTLNSQTFYLVVNVYYLSFQNEVLVDSQSRFFTTPIESSLFLQEIVNEKADNDELKFVNPSNGMIFTNIGIQNLIILDQALKILRFHAQEANIIDISNLPDGLYFLIYKRNETYKTTRIVLRKN